MTCYESNSQRIGFGSCEKGADGACLEIMETPRAVPEDDKRNRRKENVEKHIECIKKGFENCPGIMTSEDLVWKILEKIARKKAQKPLE